MTNKVNLINTDEYIDRMLKNDVELSKGVKEEGLRMEYAFSIMKLRESLGLTQEQFAEKINKPQSTVARIENGNANPTVKTLYEIGNAVGKTLKISFE